MSQSKVIIVFALITVLSIFRVTAQSACQSATGMSNVNVTQLAGVWYEEVRAPAKNVSCVKISLGLVNNQTTLSISTLYAASQNGLHMDRSDMASVNVSDVMANTGFNVSYNNANGATVTTYKILSTDYTTNAVLCGFTNAADNTTSFGVILARQQIANYTALAQVQQNAAALLSNFNGNSAVNITQSSGCYVSSAVTSAPIWTPIIAVFYALIKFLY